MEEDLGRLKSGLAAGEPASYQEAYDRFGPALFRTAARMLGRPADAEDAVQEVFSSILRSREKLSRVIDLKAYLFVSLRHAVGRIVRRRRQRSMTELDEAQLPAEPPRGDEGEAERLSQLVNRLPAEQRDVLALKIQGELTFRQIGEICGISPNTAASRYRYALEKLRQMLGEQR